MRFDGAEMTGNEERQMGNDMRQGPRTALVASGLPIHYNYKYPTKKANMAGVVYVWANRYKEQMMRISTKRPNGHRVYS